MADETTSNATSLDVMERVVRLESASSHARTDIAHLQQRTQAKPVHWLSIVTFAVSVTVLVLGAWWTLSEKFAQRPTLDQIDKIMHSHAEYGHPDVTQQMQILREAQIELRGAVDNVQGDVRAIREALRDASTAARKK